MYSLARPNYRVCAKGDLDSRSLQRASPLVGTGADL